MTEHEDLIAEARKGMRVAVDNGWADAWDKPLAVRLADVLEKVTAERDQLDAVVQQLRWLTAGSDWNGGQVDDILNAAPSVALDRVKAEAFDEGWLKSRDFFRPDSGWHPRDNPYRKGESNE